LRKITILEEQTTMTLFTMHKYQLVLKEAWDDFKVMKVWKTPKTLIAFEDKDISFGLTTPNIHCHNFEPYT
jgi:hypothetical protein